VQCSTIDDDWSSLVARFVPSCSECSRAETVFQSYRIQDGFMTRSWRYVSIYRDYGVHIYIHRKVRHPFIILNEGIWKYCPRLRLGQLKQRLHWFLVVAAKLVKFKFRNDQQCLTNDHGCHSEIAEGGNWTALWRLCSHDIDVGTACTRINLVMVLMNEEQKDHC